MKRIFFILLITITIQIFFIRAVFSTINVIDCGASPNNPDNWPNIQYAINTAAATGQDVYIPAGRFVIKSGLFVGNNGGIIGGVKIHGDGWSYVNKSNAATNRKGTWIEIDIPSGNALPNGLFINGGRGTIIRDIAFYHRSQNGNYTIKIEGTADIKLENIFLFNPYYGIQIVSGERITLNDLSGDPLYTGIDIIFTGDVLRVNNIHFWPYSTNSEATKLNQGYGIISRRADNPFFSNILTYGYYVGIYFTENSNGETTKGFELNNALLDNSMHGIAINGTEVTGSINNCFIQGCTTYGAAGIVTSGINHQIQINNSHIVHFNYNAIRIESTHTKFLINNIRLQDWNHTRQGFPGIEIVSTSLTGSYISIVNALFRFANGANPLGYDLSHFKYDDEFFIKENMN